MKAFFKYLLIQCRMDLRDRGTLMNYYLVPLLFFAIVGPVFSSVNPLIKPTLSATMSILAIIMGAVMGMPIPIVKMREQGTLRAFRVNGIPGFAVMAVQALSAFVHLFIVCVVIYFVSPVALHSQVPENPAAYFLIMALLLISSIGIGLLIGVLSRSQAYASMISMIIFFPSMMLSGIMFPAKMLPVVFRRAGYCFPATNALQSLYSYAYHLQKNSVSTALSLFAVAAAAILMFAVAGWKFHSIRENERM